MKCMGKKVLYMSFIPNGGAVINQRIAEACADGTRQVVLTGNYLIEQTILLPSDFTLILDNCHLRMEEGTFCNLMRNQCAGTESGRRLAGADRNIRIIGRGKAILDGGIYNGLCEKNHSREGRPHITVNNLLLFANVENISVTGLHLRHQRWWAMNFLYCRGGTIRDIDFLADPTISNGDGIDLRAGCRDFLIEHITGFTQDDTVALTGLNGSSEQMYAVEDLPSDICNVIIRDVQSSTCHSNIRLLNQSGVRLYNILIDGMMDTSAACPLTDRCLCGIRVGDNHLYGTRHSTPEETCNITIRNVYSRAHTVLRLAGSITDLVLDNLNGFDGYSQKIDNQADLYQSENR